jgi:hypothetical protein
MFSADISVVGPVNDVKERVCGREISRRREYRFD